MKAANEQSQTELASIIAGIHQLLEDINIQNGHTQSIISQVAHDIQEDALAHEAMPPLPPNGADEDGCQADLAEEAALAQSLEADIIAISNELSDVEAALAKEKEECEREEEEVSEVEASLEEIMRRLQALADKGGVPSSKDQEIHQEDIKKALQAKENAKSKRLRALSMWTEEAISLLQKLGGVVIPTIVHQQGSQSLEVTLGTAFPTDPVLSAHDVPVACSKVEHRLMLQLDASGYAAEAALTPADVYIADIVMQLSPDKTFRPSPGHVVREVRTRICQVSHRNALIHAASAKFPGIATLDPTLADSFTCPMTVRGVKFTVTISMEECWPMSVDRPEVVSIVSDADCESDTIIDLANRTVAGMTLEGDLTVSLQEVERALYSILQDPK